MPCERQCVNRVGVDDLDTERQSATGTRHPVAEQSRQFGKTMLVLTESDGIIDLLNQLL